MRVPSPKVPSIRGGTGLVVFYVAPLASSRSPWHGRFFRLSTSGFVLKTKSVQIDTELQDDGLYSITFYFGKSRNPYYMTLARDEYEEPDDIYFEAEDQIHGFKSREITYTLKNDILRIDLSADKSNNFFWTKDRVIEVELGSDIKEAGECLDRLFQIGRKVGS